MTEDLAIKRLTTGTRQLDEILDGGFPESSLGIIMGAPGTGKTTFAEQLMFANTGDSRPMLYLTTLSEPLEKVVRYLQQFRFFDITKLGTEIRYEALGDVLATNGIAGLAPWIKNAIKTLSPKLIVIDSFKAIHDIAKSAQEMRLMLYEVAGLLSAYNVTVLFVGEYRTEDIALYPEFAVADAIIELARSVRGNHDERYLRVLKLRGSSYRPGSHAFDVTEGGLEVYPRLVSPTHAAPYDRNATRVTSGIPGLDRLLGGGFPSGSATLVAGPTGSGKTTMGIQFIVEGLRRGERCLLVNFQENPTQLAHQVEQIGADLDADARGRLELLYYSAVELSIDRIVVSIFEALRRNPVHRLVIDAIGDLDVAASDATRIHDYLYALVQHFAAMGVSSILTLETDPPVMVTDVDHGRLSHMTDNIVFIDIRERNGIVGRTLRVAKARGVAHDLQFHEAVISAKGVSLIENKS